MEMLPRLGEKFGLKPEIISKPRQEYQTVAYEELGLPKAPAIMIGSEVVARGCDITEQELEKIIEQRLAQS